MINLFQFISIWFMNLVLGFICIAHVNQPSCHFDISLTDSFLFLVAASDCTYTSLSLQL